MSKTVKRIIISLGIGFVLMLIVLIGALAYLKTDHFSRFILSQINSAIPGSVSCQTIDLALSEGRLELSRTVLSAPDGKPLATIDGLILDLDIPALLRKELTIALLQINTPYLNLYIDKTGHLSLSDAFPSGAPTAKKQKSAKLPFNIIVKAFELTGGSVIFRQEAASPAQHLLSADLQEISIHTTGNLARRQALLKLDVGQSRIHVAGNSIRLNGIHLTSNADLNLEEGRLNLQTNRANLNISGIEIPVDFLKLDVSYKQKRIRVKALSVAACGSQLNMAGEIQDALGTPFLDIRVGLNAELAMVPELLQSEIPLDGSAQLDMGVRGNLNNPVIELQVAYDGGVLAGYQIDAANLDCALQDFRFDIRHLHLKKDAGSIGLAGRINLKDFFANGLMAPTPVESGGLEQIAYDLMLEADHFGLARFLAADKALNNKNSDRGSVNAAISLKGRGIDPARMSAKATIDLAVNRLSLASGGMPTDWRLQADAQLKDQVLRIDRLKADGDRLNLDASGRWNITSGDLNATAAFDAANLSESLAPLGISQIAGEMKLNADVSGTASHPVFKASLAGKSLRFHRYTIGNLIFDAVLNQNGLLKIAQLDISNQDSALEAAGSVQLFKNGFVMSSEMASSLKIKLNNIALNDFFPAPVFHGRIDGQIDTRGNLNDLQTQVVLHGRRFGYDVYQADDLFLDGRVEGSLKKPHFPQTTLKALALDLGVQKLEEVKIIGDVDLEKVIVHQLDIAPVAGENIHASGLINYKGGFKINLLSGPVDLAHIDALSHQDIVGGKVIFDMKGEGCFSDPAVNADLQFTQIHIKEKPLDDFQLHLSLQDHLAQVNGRLNFDIDAAYHLKQKIFQAKLAFDQTDLAPYFKLANQPDFNGMATGRIEVQGKADAISQTRGEAAFNELRLGFKQPDMVVTRDLQVRFENNGIVIPGSTLKILDKGRLKIQGRAQMDANADIQVEGEFPVEIISHFSDALPDLKGNLLISASVDGAIAQPNIRAQVDLEKIGFTIPGLMQRIDHLNGSIQATPDAVIINHINGRMEKGRFNLDGRIDLEKYKPVRANLSLHTDALPLHIDDLLDLSLNTDLLFQGTPDRSGLSGEVVILDGTYYQDIDLNLLKIAKSARNKKREITPARAPINQPFLRNLALDIAVRRRNPFIVDNNLAYLEINPNLDIGGTPNEPVVSGRAEVESGEVTFNEKKFTITRGIIEFLNPYKIEPTIDLQSEAQIRKWTVLLNVKGPPDQLRFTLTSEPPEEQSDLLTLILTGQTTKELSQSGGKGSTLSSEMVASYLGKSFGDDISKMAGLDTFEVQTAGQGTEDDPETVTVTVGKELSERMGVAVKMEKKAGKTVERGEIEYKLLEHFKVKGFQDSRGAIGGELFFRLEFR